MSQKSQAVWIIAGGQMQVPAVEAAHRLGLSAIVSDRNSECACAKLADEFVTVDIYDVPGHIKAADELSRQWDIRGIFTEGADCHVSVSELAKYLGLPGCRPFACLVSKNKAFTRFHTSTEYNLSPVWWNEVRRPWAIVPPSYPVMVKAVDNCGSRGTQRVDRQDQLAAAIANAIENSTTRTALLEEFLEGPQQSVEILIDVEGRCHFLNIVDRLFDGVMELGHVNPSRLGVAQIVELFELTKATARAVRFDFGAFKCDTIWTKDGPRILECTARLSGGWDAQLSTPRATGRDFITAAMALACGLPIDPEWLLPKFNRYCAVWTAFPKPGRVVSINSALAGLPDGVTDVILRVSVGDTIAPYTHCATRPAFVAAVADTYDEAVIRAKAGAASLAERIVTE